MAPKKSVPKMRHHKATGQAVVTLTDARTGRRVDRYCGTYGTADAAKRYAATVEEWEQQGRTLPGKPQRTPKPEADQESVAQLALDYLEHTRKRGVGENEVRAVQGALRVLRSVHGATPVADFGPRALIEYREAIIAIRRGKKQRRLTRSTVNRYVRIIIRAFRWAVANERAPRDIPEALSCVEPLRVGEFGVPEGRTVKPVPEAHVDDIREHVSSIVWAMITVQRYSAARAGEVCVMRPKDLDVSGNVWLYRPPQHKNRHRGHERVIYLGERSQAVLKPLLLGRALDAPMFSPRESMAERRATNATEGKPRREGQKPTPTATTRKVREQFTTDSYARAIARACESAGVPTWTTHQLRHLAATNARKEFGAEAALLVLGDKSTRLVDVYAEKDEARAKEVIAKIG